MEEIYPEHTVSVKIALFSQDLSNVLLMKYAPGHYGLPGGHLEHNELPDEALERELQEELGVTLDAYEQSGFFLRGERGTSVILGYKGIAPADLVLEPPHPEEEFGIWVSVTDALASPDLSQNYKDHILRSRPE